MPLDDDVEFESQTDALLPDEVIALENQNDRDEKTASADSSDIPKSPGSAKPSKDGDPYEDHFRFLRW